MLLFVIGFKEINSKILFKNWLAFKALDLKFRSKKVFLFQEWTAAVHNQGTHKEQSFLASYEFQFMLMQYNRPKNPSLIIHLMRWWSTDDCLGPETFKETHTDKVMITFWMMLLQILIGICLPNLCGCVGLPIFQVFLQTFAQLAMIPGLSIASYHLRRSIAFSQP